MRCTSSNCPLPMNPLLKVFVVVDVLCSAHQNKPNMVSAVIAWRKCFSVDASHFMLGSVIGVMNNLVDSRPFYSLTWLVFCGHRSPLLMIKSSLFLCYDGPFFWEWVHVRSLLIIPRVNFLHTRGGDVYPSSCLAVCD